MDERSPAGLRPWHASAELLDGFTRVDLDPARAASVELHLLECADCRARLARRAAVDDRLDDALEATWLDVIDDIDRPKVGVVQSLLGRLGFSELTARVVAATPALRLSWLASIVVVLTFAIVAAVTTAADTLLLVVAPLIPLAGIGAAYGAGVDPVHELMRAAPVAASRIFLARALAVLATSLPLAVAASLVLPIDHETALVWLAPALGLVGLTMALSTWIEPRWAALATSAAWISGLGIAWARAAVLEAPRLTSALPFRPGGQLAFVALAVAGCAVFWRRHALFDDPRPRPTEVF